MYFRSQFNPKDEHGKTNWKPRRLDSIVGIKIPTDTKAPTMCNLYSLTTSHEAMRQLFKADRLALGDWDASAGICPDQLASVVSAESEGRRLLSLMRWGIPPPPAGKRPVTNVRNSQSSFWRQWLNQPAHRCLVPFTSFCEWSQSGPKTPHWFALHEADNERPLTAFAGIWRDWSGKRRGEEKEHQLMAFLTADANDIVRPIHPKAMPVLGAPEDFDVWL